MAKTASTKVKKADITALKNLPRNPTLVLIGGRRALPLAGNENPLNEASQLIFWLQADNGRIRARRYVRPREGVDSVNEALSALLTAIAGPFFPGDELAEGGLPARIVTDDPALAEAATPLFATLKIPVELIPETSESLTPYHKLLSDIGAVTGSEPQSISIPDLKWTADEKPERLAELLRAANAGFRNFAEEYLPSYWAFTVRLKPKKPQKPRQFWFCVLGDGDRPGGYVFYNSLEDLERDRKFRHTETEPSEVGLQTLLDKLRDIRALGDNLFYLDELVDIARRSGTEPASASGVESYAVYYTPIDFVPPQYLQWLSKHKLKYGSREGVPVWVHRAADGSLQPLQDKDAADLATALPGVAELFRMEKRSITIPHYKRQKFSSEYKVEAAKAYGVWDSVYDRLVNAVTVQVEFPAPGYQFPEGDEIDGKLDPNSIEGLIMSALDRRINRFRSNIENDEDEKPVITQVELAPGHIVQYIEYPEVKPVHPASSIAHTTVYRLKVALQWEKSRWRRLEITGDQTLHHLHNAIQEAFDWDNDHLYSFFLSNKAWDARSEYSHPQSQNGALRADKYRIERLMLRPGKRFLYIFDFGDELTHDILVEDILPGAAEPGVEYPCITEIHGENIPQYGRWGDEEDYDEDYDDEE